MKRFVKTATVALLAFVMLAGGIFGNAIVANATNVPQSRDNINRSFIGNKTVSIDYFGEDEFLADIVIEMSEDLRVLKRSGATEDELNSYFYAELARHQSEVRFDMYDYLANRLNSQEQALMNAHPALAALCLANAQFAITYAESNYHSYVLHNDNGDAFRHVIWNYGMCCDVGYSFAKQWSDAHEYGASGQPTIERQMDLYNNSVGLALGVSYPGTILHSTFVNRSKEKVRTGQCYVIIGNSLSWSDSYGEK